MLLIIYFYKREASTHETAKSQKKPFIPFRMIRWAEKQNKGVKISGYTRVNGS